MTGGRGRLTGHLTVRLPESVDVTLRQYAADHDLPVGYVVRQAVAAYLADAAARGGPPPPVVSTRRP